MNSSVKASRRTITLGVLVTFLIVGLIAAFIVVQGQIDVRKQASELSCRINLVRCSWEWSGPAPQNADKIEYEYSVSGPCNNTPERPCSGTTSTTSIEFEGFPGGSFTCNVTPKVTVGGQLCPVNAASGSGSCLLESSVNGDNAALIEPPASTPPSSCGCTEDGGKLNCRPEEIADYGGSAGPGLIILDPIYEVGDTACFKCQKFLVRDSSGSVIREIDGCRLPQGEDLRIHQAGSEAGKCETYLVEAIGADGEQTSPSSCQTCKHTVCCPSCVAPRNLTVETLTSDASDPLGKVTVDSCSFGCDFDISFAGQNQCSAPGEKITLTVPEGSCVEVDDDFTQENKVCDTDNDGIIEVSYSRGGVYDIGLICGDLATSSATVGLDGGAVQSSIPSDLRCTKRITVACDEDTPDSPGDSSGPTGSPTPTPTPTPGACKKLDVEMICHNCP